MLRSRLAILGAAVLWSSAGAAIKLAHLSAWQIAGGRSLVACITLAAIFATGRRRVSRKGFLVALAYAATVVLFVVANKLTTAANAIFLQDTAPLYVLLLSPLLLKEKPSRGELTAAPVFLLGLALFFVDDLQAGQLAGNLIALGSGVAFALCIMGLRATHSEGASVLVWGNGIAALAALGPAIATAHGAPSPTDIGILVFLGTLQLGAAYALFQYGVRETPATEASLLILLEPVLNPIWTFLLAGEKPGRWAITGGAIILAATAWRTLASVRPVPATKVDVRNG